MTLVAGIVHYGVGNIGSIVSAFRKIGVETVIVSEENDVRKCDLLVFPGVGSFDSAITRLRRILPSLDKVVAGIPILGICLGMQILFESSEEGGESGLAVFKGRVTLLRSNVIPHIGWNTVKITKETPLVCGVPDNSYFYFAHSYCVEIDSAEAGYVAGITEIGHSRFVSIISDEKRAIYGTQFHPERSSKVGLKLLQNFAALAKK